MGYVVIAIFLGVSGLFFSSGLLQSYQDIVSELGFLQSFLFIIVPLLTMRSFSEDRKNGTEVLLYTSPASTMEIVLGKYLAALAMMMTLLAGTLVHVLIDTEALAVLLFTSGTTAMSKAVMLSQRNICINLHAMCQMLYVDRSLYHRRRL